MNPWRHAMERYQFGSRLRVGTALFGEILLAWQHFAIGAIMLVFPGYAIVMGGNWLYRFTERTWPDWVDYGNGVPAVVTQLLLVVVGAVVYLSLEFPLLREALQEMGERIERYEGKHIVRLLNRDEAADHLGMSYIQFGRIRDSDSGPAGINPPILGGVYKWRVDALDKWLEDNPDG